MRETFLLTTEQGVSHYMVEDDQGMAHFKAVGETDPVVEHNKKLITENDGYSPTRELRRVASIPFILINKWIVEEGVNVLLPENADFLRKKLSDPDYAFLRTAEGRLGMSNGVLR